MVDLCPQVTWSEEVNTVQIGNVHSSMYVCVCVCVCEGKCTHNYVMQ